MMDRGQDESGWCILRTSPGRTLPLARSLAAAGYNVWTPQLVVSRRRPRSKKTVERDAPILPTFVFIHAADLPDLFDMLSRPFNSHPAFSIFRHAGRLPMLRDEQMAGLRKEEADALAVRQANLDRAARAAAARNERERVKMLRETTSIPPLGTKVRLPNSAFTGLVGEVEGSKGTAVLVNFGGGHAIKIDAWLLEPDQIENATA